MGAERYRHLRRNIVTIELKVFVEIAFPARIEVYCPTSFVDDHIQSLMRNSDWGIANPDETDRYLCNAIHQVVKSRWSTSSQPRRSHLISHYPQGLQNPWRLGLPPQGLGIVVLDQYISSEIPAHFVSENIRQQSELLEAHRATVPASSKATCLVFTKPSFPVAETNSAKAVANVLPSWRSSTPK